MEEATESRTLAQSHGAEARAKRYAKRGSWLSDAMMFVGVVGIAAGGVLGATVAIGIVLGKVLHGWLQDRASEYLVLSRSLRRLAVFGAQGVGAALVEGIALGGDGDALHDEGLEALERYDGSYWEDSSSVGAVDRYRESSYYSSELYRILASKYRRRGFWMLLAAISVLIVSSLVLGGAHALTAVRLVVTILVAGLGVGFLRTASNATSHADTFNDIFDCLSGGVSGEELTWISTHYELHRSCPPVLPTELHEANRDKIRKKWIRVRGPRASDTPDGPAAAESGPPG